MPPRRASCKGPAHSAGLLRARIGPERASIRVRDAIEGPEKRERKTIKE
jgi:hypothetical protein